MYGELSEREVIQAPQWLKDRMEKLRNMPKPSVEKIRAQMRACEEYEWRNPYKDAKVIR